VSQGNWLAQLPSTIAQTTPAQFKLLQELHNFRTDQGRTLAGSEMATPLNYVQSRLRNELVHSFSLVQRRNVIL